MVKIQESKTHSLGFGVTLEFQLTQHVRDEKLMKRGPRRTHWMRRGPLNVMVRPSRLTVARAAHCGKIFKDREAINFKVTKTKDFTEKIIPFFF